MVQRLQFDIDVPQELRLLTQFFHQRGHELFLVGGAVRDALMKVPPKDFDVATDAYPDVIVDILQLFVGVTILEVGRAFGVIKVIFPSGFECEIATFRSDVGTGRRPDSVVFTNIEEDVKRRDLTINALFYDLGACEIVDYVGGIDDIREGVVRTVGSPRDRFNEDKLRILRAIRFAAQLGCELDHETEASIIEDCWLSGVSHERIHDELLKGISKARSVTHFVHLIDRLGMWSQVLPGLHVLPDDVREVRDPALLLGLLLSRSNDSQSVERVLRAMKYTIDEIRQVTFLIEFQWLMPDTGPRLYKKFAISGLSIATITKFSQFRLLDKNILKAFIDYRPTVKGDELMAQGFQGRELGIELERREVVEFTRLFNEHYLVNFGTQGRLDLDVQRKEVLSV